MLSFRDWPIRHKLLGMFLITGGLALLLSGIATIIAESLLYRTSMQNNLASLAMIAGDNSTAALTFDDPRVATEVLGALKARPHMIAACTYRADGSVFARYMRSGLSGACPAPGPDDEVRSTGTGITVTHPIILKNQRIGSIVLLADNGELGERIRIYGGIVLVILVVSSLLALLLSAGLRNTIAGPISSLAGAASSISNTADYSVRVEKTSGDELGVLVDSFNQMVQRIQSRDREILNARNSLQTTLISIGDAVISTDVEGRIVFINPVAVALLGRTLKDTIGKPIAEVFRIVNELTREPVENPIDRVLREGRAAGLANHTILIAADGSEIPIDDSAAPIRENDQITGVVLVFRDIRERRRAQQDAAYLAAIVESSEDAIVATSPEGVIQTWNRGAERLYGYKAEEVIGRPMAELLPPDRIQEEVEILDRLRTGELVHRFETVRLRKDGVSVDVALSISTIRDRNGGLIGISHVAHDISEQKRAAEQMRQTQKLESLGILAGGIAHDFNNLLTGIVGNASLALEDLDGTSPARGPIQSVLDASDKAALLARQMLAYSGKGQFVLDQIDISASVRETLPLIRTSIPSNVELRLQLEENLPLVEADVAQIQQVVLNIIINAAEAIPAGSPGTVTVTTRRQQINPGMDGSGAFHDLRPGPYVLFEVKDTGIGMDEHTKARIFDPFFTTKFTGRGLGLAAVLGIIRGHHGSINVASVLGAGTMFRVLFPVATGVRSAKVEKPGALPADYQGSGLVLVVDDEYIVRALAKDALERHGFTAIVAEGGVQGLEIYRRELDRLRCVILDLTMPAMSGEETLEQMKTICPDIPIILSSGFNQAQAVPRFEGKGLAGFLQKPYKAGELLEVVRRFAREARAAQ